MSHKFVNIHELISHNPSCLNRDDMNMQKSAVFGGVRRARISSQCLKRAFRFSQEYKEESRSTRTSCKENMFNKSLEIFPEKDPTIIRYILLQAMPKEKVMTAWIKCEMELFINTIENIIGEPVEKNISDLKKICDSLSGVSENSEGEETDKNKKNKLSKELDSLNIKLAKALKTSEEEFLKSGISSVDVALSGRMCASGVLENVEAAMSMSHAITTHAMEAEIDWFTAMDDLKEEADDAGAGHLNTQEFGAGVFYQYASVDVDLLAKNLGTDRINALEVIGKYLRIMAMTTPGGKQHSFASHSLAHCVMVSLSDMPLSLANAFENPIKKGREGYVIQSVKAMLEYWEKIHKAYEINEDVAIFTIDDSNIKYINDHVKAFETIADLQEWITKED